MKVRITFDITDDERVAISVAQGNGFKEAPRDDIERWITATVSHRRQVLNDRFAIATREMRLDLVEVDEEEQQ